MREEAEKEGKFRQVWSKYKVEDEVEDEDNLPGQVLEFSSERSVQSSTKSQVQLCGIHCPLSHANWDEEHAPVQLIKNNEGKTRAQHQMNITFFILRSLYLTILYINVGVLTLNLNYCAVDVWKQKFSPVYAIQVYIPLFCHTHPFTRQRESDLTTQAQAQDRVWCLVL